MLVRSTPIQCPSELGCRYDQHPFFRDCVKFFRDYEIWQFVVLSNSCIGVCDFMSSPRLREFVDLRVVILCLAHGAAKGHNAPAAATGSQDAKSQGPSPISSAITLVPLCPPNCYNSHALCLVPSDNPIQFFYRVYQYLLLIQLALSWARPVMSIGPALMCAVPCRS